MNVRKKVRIRKKRQFNAQQMNKYYGPNSSFSSKSEGDRDEDKFINDPVREIEDEVTPDSVSSYTGHIAGDRSAASPLHLSCNDTVHIFRSRPVTILTRCGCWLYIQVAFNTTAEPIINGQVMRKSNSATEARKEMTMLKLVAKPLRILSEYLMTIAVTKPPSTWTSTVAQAHNPKLLNRLLNQLAENVGGACAAELLKIMCATHGSREKSDSWTLRTQRSAWEFFSTISK